RPGARAAGGRAGPPGGLPGERISRASAGGRWNGDGSGRGSSLGSGLGADLVAGMGSSRRRDVWGTWLPAWLAAWARRPAPSGRMGFLGVWPPFWPGTSLRPAVIGPPRERRSMSQDPEAGLPFRRAAPPKIDRNLRTLASKPCSL